MTVISKQFYVTEGNAIDLRQLLALDDNQIFYSAGSGINGSPAYINAVMPAVTGDTTLAPVQLVVVNRTTNLAQEYSLTFNVREASNGVTINASPNQDIVVGTAGQDIIYGNNKNDIIEAGNGNDTVYGGSGHNIIRGGAGHDTLNGGNGNDQIDGGNDNDTINGGAGNDIIDGGRGVNSLTGGAGNDTFKIVASDAGKNTITDYTAGSDKLNLVGTAAEYAALSITQSGADALVTFGGSTTTLKNTLVADIVTTHTEVAAPIVPINGTDAGETILGTNGVDHINALGGNDTINAGAGNDVINAGEGADIVKAGGGHDTVYGGAGNDDLDGEAGNDIIFGGGGHDIIKGGYGNDFLYGEANNDTIDGGDGDDAIDGGSGVNNLTGGAGADKFFFRTNESSSNTVTDFTSQDILRFAGDAPISATQHGADAWIDVGGTHVELVGINASTLVFSGTDVYIGTVPV